MRQHDRISPEAATVRRSTEQVGSTHSSGYLICLLNLLSYFTYSVIFGLPWSAVLAGLFPCSNLSLTCMYTQEYIIYHTSEYEILVFIKWED